MRLLLLLVGLLLALSLVAAEARMHAPYRGHRIVPGASAPLDGFTTPSGAYSFRKLKSNYAGPAIRVRRASDNAETDINFLGFTSFTGAPLDTAAASAHCAATSCFGVNWYDQSGAARHMAQVTPANQPQLVFNCNGTLPCWQTTLATQSLNTANVTPATGVTSFSAVARRNSGTGFCLWLMGNGVQNRLASAVSANNVILFAAGSGTGITVAALDNVWHAEQAVIAAAASVISVDGVETTGNISGNTTAGGIGIVGGAASTCLFAEAIDWDNYQLTVGERTALQTNQKSFWGTP